MIRKTSASGEFELSHRERDLILAQERYRSEIQAQLNNQNGSRSSPLIRFLNSSLGLWLLSAVFISGLGALYDSYSRDREKQAAIETEERARGQKADDEISRLDQEISFRLSEMIAKLYKRHLQQQKASQRDRMPVPVEPADLYDFVRLAPSHASPSSPSSLHQANRDSTLPSLMAQLAYLERSRKRGDDRASASIEGVIAHLGDLDGFFEVGKLSEKPANALAVAAAINRQVLLPRWKESRFYYTYCSSESPFC